MQEDYGIDWNGPLSVDNDNIVTVPDTECPLFPEQFSILQATIDPLQSCEDFGVQIYIETREFVYTCINDE